MMQTHTHKYSYTQHSFRNTLNVWKARLSLAYTTHHKCHLVGSIFPHTLSIPLGSISHIIYHHMNVVGRLTMNYMGLWAKYKHTQT